MAGTSWFDYFVDLNIGNWPARVKSILIVQTFWRTGERRKCFICRLRFYCILAAGALKIGKWLDAQGIAARTGHHCAQSILACFRLESGVRPSFAFYNTKAEVDLLVGTLRRIRLRR